MKKPEPEQKNHYKVILSELKDNPIAKIKISFALMGVIPLLVLFYLFAGKNNLHELFLGANGFIITISIFISIMGFFLAYRLVINMVNKMLVYFTERKVADEEKLQLLTGLSHDLKTPLTVTKAGLQNMLSGIGGSINIKQKEMVDMCLNAVNRVSSFIIQMLDISRLKITSLSLKRELVDFEKVVKDEVKEIFALAKQNNQRVVSNIVSEDIKLWGDKGKLSRAIMNLLSNAIKYTNTNGRIDVITSSDEETINFAVINTGSGIPTDKLDKIFNKYERLSSASKIEGTGLGLSIVKDIVDLHKGHIIVTSEPNKETKFDIVLPRDLRTKARIA